MICGRKAIINRKKYYFVHLANLEQEREARITLDGKIIRGKRLQMTPRRATGRRVRLIRRPLMALEDLRKNLVKLYLT